MTNALSKVTKYQYDEVSNLTNQIDALSHTNRFQYDSMARRTKRTLPGNQVETLGYDAAGNLLAYTNFNGLSLTNQYDVMNRLWKRWNAGTLLETYTYDKVGQLTNRLDTSGNYAWVFDLRGRALTNSTPVGALYYQYDRNGNLTNLASATSSGTLLSYQYDALDRLTNVVDSHLTGMSVTNTSYAYDGVGNLQAYKYPNGVTNLYQYDTLNRLTNLDWKTNGVSFSSYVYSLAPAGNRSQLVELLNTTSRTNQWSYDQNYRITNEVINGGSVTGNLSYMYDDVGNRLSRGGSGNVTNTVTPKAYAYDSNDRISPGESYDNNGNTTTTLDGYTFGYDYNNRLTNSGVSVAVVYGADGNRTKKTVSGAVTLYLVAQVNPTGYPQVVEELTVSGGTTNLSKIYTYGLDLISQKQVSGSTISFYGYDGLGSVRFLTGTNGAVSDTSVYDAFGTQITSSGSTPNNYRFTGEQNDPDLNVYYLRARYYKNGTGRLVTMDSYGGNREDPLSLHKYLYAAEDPVNNIDPSGHETLVEVMGATTVQNLLVTAVVTTAATYVWQSTKNLFSGAPPNGIQRAKIDQAIVIIKQGNLSNDLAGYAKRAEKARIRIDKRGSMVRGEYYLGATRPYFHFIFFDTIHISEDAFDIDDKFLAATLMHEAVHLKQWVPAVFQNASEGPAYQVESDFLRAIRIDGSLSQLIQQFPGEPNHEYLHYSAVYFQKYRVKDPAVQ